MNFKSEMEQRIQRIESILDKYLPKEAGYAKTVMEAMNYSAKAGGKRLRPMLMEEVYGICGGTKDVIEPFMAALEMIHTYSLIHDDLPAMDNDDLRRGRPTNHIVFGESMAILAGDGLLNYAFETASKAFDMDAVKTLEDYKAVAGAIQILGRKAGIYGMIGGQTVDVESEKSNIPLDLNKILFIHENKTAALIQAAMMIGAKLAGAGKDTVEALEKCAYDIGIAFQIQDDILDVVGDQTVLGKPIGSDAENQKQTYVSIYGLDASKQEVERLSHEAIGLLKDLQRENNGEFLLELVRQLTVRDR